MSSYFIAQIKIKDWDEYENYLRGFDQVFRQYKGKVVAVDDHPTVLEGEWPYTRMVIIRFPNEKETLRWYRSPEYQALIKHRLNASQANTILVQGRI